MALSISAEQPMMVAIGNHVVEGWLVEPDCGVCGGPRLYYLAFDATCCPACNVWLDLLCSDPDCIHCRCRPERPWTEPLSAA